MKSKFSRTQRNYIIAGLCMILVIMAVGYSAFASQLKISGTSNISSNFLVRITDIQSTVLNGQASDAQTPSHTETTATFKTNLVSPGDAMRYDITVANEGSIDAVLNSIDVNTGSNDAITFETSGIKEGDALLKSTTDVLTVIVRYNSSVTSQPESTESTITVTLNYGQSDGTALPGVDGPLIGGQEVELVESGDGLYEDSTRAGRYVYKGADPDNYIEFNDELWRIVAKEADGTYKIVRNELLSEEMPFDNDNYRDEGSGGAGGTYCANSSYGCNAWAANANLVGSPAEFTNTTQTGTVLLDSSLNTYLNGEYYNSLSPTAQSQIVSHEWGVGATYTEVSWNDDEDEDPSEFVEEESAFKWIGKVALLSSSDVHLSVSNESLCGTDNKYYENLETCAANNWVIPENESDYYWLLSPRYRNSNFVLGVYGGGNFSVGRNAHLSYGVRPAVFLTSSLNLSGEGTQSNPFSIN